MKRSSAGVFLIIAMTLMTMDCASTGQSLPQGRTTVTAKCSACHLAPTPRSIDTSALDALFEAHRRRVQLTPSEKLEVRIYLEKLPNPDSTTSR
jgi:hypothetical protein